MTLADAFHALSRPMRAPSPTSEDAPSADPVRAYRFTHHPSLDGFRGAAAMLVACYHTQAIPRLAGGGQAAMEMFFVLSGFLITSILRREQEESGRIRVSRFYVRRMRRLVPALVVYSVVAVGLALVTAWWSRRGTMLNALASVTYTSNWFQLHFSDIPIVFGHTWSLAIEEQYYLTWPLILLAWSRLTLRRRWLAVLALMGASLVWRELIVLHEPVVDRIRNGTDTRAVALLAGGVLALGLERKHPIVERVLKSSAMGLSAGAALVFSWFAVGVYTGGMFMTWMIVAIVASTVLIGHSVVGEATDTSSILIRALRFGPLVWLGAVSYSLYLWHPLAIAALRHTDVVNWARPARLGTMMAASLALAVVSYVTIERRFRAPRSASAP